MNYKGTGPALTALMGGEIDFGFDTVSGAIGHVKSGKLRALAVTSKKRSTALPDVPTVARDRAARLRGDRLVRHPGAGRYARTDRRAAQQGAQRGPADAGGQGTASRISAIEPLGGSPADFGKLIETETARYGDVIRRLGIKAE